MLVAVEDVLGETIARRLVEAIRPDLTVWAVLGLSGNGYLRRRCREFNRTATKVPVMLLTDQDVVGRCPAQLIGEWLTVPRNPNFLFRVAVMEVESWVMADREGFAGMLRVPVARVPKNPDVVPTPKELIVNLARESRSREIRADLVPSNGATTQVGPAYNARLSHFASTTWDPDRAAKASPSLARTVRSLLAAFRA